MSGPSPYGGESALVEAAVEEGQPTTLTVAKSIAAVTDKPPDELPPLENSIDTDALNRLFENTFDDGRLVFQHAGLFVCVEAVGWISVHEEDPRRGS